jgi:hypothetical protein
MPQLRPGRPARAVPRTEVLGPRQVLGTPALPPAVITGHANRIRAGLSRAQRGTGLPPVRILEAALASLDLAVLAAVCRLDVPDRLRQPVTMVRLASELAVDEDRLARLLRYAATRGWLRLDRRGRVRGTRVTAFLRRDHPGDWRAWIEFASGDEVGRALAVIDRGLAGDGDAFEAANGAPFFTWMQEHPDRHGTFDRAMAAGGRMHGLLLGRTLDWSTSRTVCDIGGGDGALLGALIGQHPHLEGVLLDLPSVIERAPARPRVRALGGDAFSAVPEGCDTYLLVNVLHDWDDAAAIRLLRRAAETAAAGDGARVVILESEAAARPRDDLALRADLLMLALTPGGRERTTREFAALAEAAGLHLERTHHLASGDVAHVCRRASRSAVSG